MKIFKNTTRKNYVHNFVVLCSHFARDIHIQESRACDIMQKKKKQRTSTERMLLAVLLIFRALR